MGDYEISAVRNGWMVNKSLDRGSVFSKDDLIVFTDFEKLCDWIKENIKPLD
jgi:hypothetical protein